MKKTKITATYIDNPNEKMCFFTYIDNMNFVKIATDDMGHGSVNWGEKWYKFNFFEYDCERVGLDWEDESFKKSKSTMNILGRRLVVGEIIVYSDGGQRFSYKITSLDFVPTPVF